jgi:hypothetical protein
MDKWCNRADFRSLLPALLRGEDPEFSAYINHLAASEHDAYQSKSNYS